MDDKFLFSNNIRKLRAQTKTISIESLEDFVQKLQMLIKERHEEEKKAREVVIEHNKKVEKYLSMLQSEGIEVNDLIEKAAVFPTFKKLRKIRTKRPAKYQYHNENKEERTWTGQGRMPKPIRLAIESGKKSMEDFLI